MDLYLQYLAYMLVLSTTTLFTMELYVDLTLCIPIDLVEIYRHVLPSTPILSVETSVHGLPRSSVHMLLRASLLVLPHVYVSVHGILLASIRIPL